MTSGPVEAAPEGGAVSEVGRTGEGREPNNDTTPTPGFEYSGGEWWCAVHGWGCEPSTCPCGHTLYCDCWSIRDEALL